MSQNVCNIPLFSFSDKVCIDHGHGFPPSTLWTKIVNVTYSFPVNISEL